LRKFWRSVRLFDELAPSVAEPDLDGLPDSDSSPFVTDVRSAYCRNLRYFPAGKTVFRWRYRQQKPAVELVPKNIGSPHRTLTSRISSVVRKLYQPRFFVDRLVELGSPWWIRTASNAQNGAEMTTKDNPRAARRSLFGLVRTKIERCKNVWPTLWPWQ